MSVVYQAVDQRLGRQVALKAPRHESDPDALRRTLRELRLTSRLVHPNIVALLGAFDHEGQPWLVMELVEGMSLREALDRDGSLPMEEVGRHGAELAGALDLAHGYGILHRDISPGNILMTTDGRARLTDFGLARPDVGPRGGRESMFAGRSSSARPELVGTPAYMAPEQILGQTLDARTDIFSLGAVLYEMWTGRPAFIVPDREDLHDALLNRSADEGLTTVGLAPLRSERTTPPERAPRLLEILRKALAIDPVDRYRSAALLEADFRAAVR